MLRKPQQQPQQQEETSKPRGGPKRKSTAGGTHRVCRVGGALRRHHISGPVTQEKQHPATHISAAPQNDHSPRLRPSCSPIP